MPLKDEGEYIAELEDRAARETQYTNALLDVIGRAEAALVLGSVDSALEILGGVLNTSGRRD